jgi:hypothetical protein
MSNNIQEIQANFIKQTLDHFDKYHSATTVINFHEFIRSAEELINLPLYIDDKSLLECILTAIPNEQNFPEKIKLINLTCPKDIATRIIKCILQVFSIKIAFETTGSAVIGDSIQAYIDYLQSRRRHFIGFFYLLPRICHGVKKFDSIDTLNELAPTIENYKGITNLQFHHVLSKKYNTYNFNFDGTSFSGSHWTQLLDNFAYTEASRMSISDVIDKNQTYIEAKKFDTIFSVNELKHQIFSIESAFSEYALTTDLFIRLKNILFFVIENYVVDDYFIKIETLTLEALIKCYAKDDADFSKILITNTNSFMEAINLVAPFVEIEGFCVSNVNLIMRFFYNFTTNELNKIKKFQVHSGFMFEKSVIAVLSNRGFKIENIRRIQRKEFDVVTTKSGEIYNFQCKNSYINTSLINSNPGAYIKNNNHLERYFERALKKETARESLLTKTLGIEKINHYVISRFPVLTTNKFIIPFNRLETHVF